MSGTFTIQPLFPDSVVTECSLVADADCNLYPEEMASMQNAVQKRRQEFGAGRGCARTALARLGFADVAIEICHLEDTLLLPAAALIDNRYVVLYDNGVARQIPVKVGKRNANHYQVIEGLEAGQEVVVEGNYDLKDGADILREEAGQ